MANVIGSNPPILTSLVLRVYIVAPSEPVCSVIVGVVSTLFCFNFMLVFDRLKPCGILIIISGFSK